jgi:hypothetical protein
VIMIREFKNEFFIEKGGSVLLESKGVFVHTTFNKQKQLVSLHVKSIEFTDVQKSLPVQWMNHNSNQFGKKTNRLLCDFSNCFQLIIIPSVLTSSHLPEYWLIGDSFLYRHKMCTSFIRLTDLLKPTMYIIANDQRNFGRQLDFLMFDWKNKNFYNHGEINDYLRNYNFSQNHTSYWIEESYFSSICVPNSEGQHHFARHWTRNEFILTILDDIWIVSQNVADTKCLNVFTQESILFSKNFDASLVDEIYNDRLFSESLKVIGLGDGIILFLTSKSRLLMFDISKFISKVLRTNVEKVYFVCQGIVKILPNNSSIMETIDLRN